MNGGKGRTQSDAALSRVAELLAGHPAGLHRLGAPATVLDAALPAPLAALCRTFDGAELYHETLVLHPSSRLAPAGERWPFGELGGDELSLDPTDGAVWRREADTGEAVPEGSDLARWLWGAVEAEATLLGRDWEYADDVFDEQGELLPAAAMRRERRLLERDRRAPAPRWRLAGHLIRAGRLEEGRRELEQVVADRPDFGWGWFDLARLSERLGEHVGAVEEACAAAEADPDYEHVAFFWAHAARLAVAAGDEARRADCAARALALDPDLPRAQREGARETLEAGDVDAARELCDTAAALAPHDLAVLELGARIRAAEAEAETETEAETGRDRDPR